METIPESQESTPENSEDTTSNESVNLNINSEGSGDDDETASENFESDELSVQSQETSLQVQHTTMEISQNLGSFDVLPTVQDLLEKKTCDNRESAPHTFKRYLSSQINRLQDDLAMPLRDKINDYLNENLFCESDDLVFVYENVQLLGYAVNESRFGVEVKFEIPENFQPSEHFSMGAILLLTRDDFQTIMFVSVAGNNKENMSKGCFFVEPIEEAKITPDMFQFKYILLETRINFPLYFNMLSSLKNIERINFPLENYLMGAHCRKAPGYLKNEYYTKYESNLHLLARFDEIWPRARDQQLDESQLDALKSALTREFSMIQGSPGTGKTFLTSKIVQQLLEIKENWIKYGPLVIVTSTDHALDRILEDVLSYTKSVVRVGNRPTENETLKPISLTEKRKRLGNKSGTMNSSLYEKKKEIEIFLKSIGIDCLCIRCLTTPNVIVPLRCLCDVYFPLREFQYDDELIAWLTGLSKNTLSKNLSSCKEAENQPEDGEDDNDNNDNNNKNKEQEDYNDAECDLSFDVKINADDCKPIFTLDFLDQQINALKKTIQQKQMLRETEPSVKIPSHEFAFLEEKLNITITEKLLLQSELAHHPLLSHLDLHLEASKEMQNFLNSNKTETFQSNSAMKNLHWEKYWKWVKSSHEFLVIRVLKMIQYCQKYKEKYQVIKQAADLEIMREHQVVGITATCAIKLQASLQDLGAPIVLVNETGKIPEAHVLSALSEECKQLILIGDYEQTVQKRPLSLFERVASISKDCVKLTHQHRMRPEIAKLLFPLDSQKVYNSNSLDYPDIKGVNVNLFFIDHDYREESCDDEKDSWVNMHEVTFFVEFARYLLYQEYRPTDVTILCTYDSQVLAFNNALIKNEQLKQIHVSTVKNYEGSENKIVLLSLVRNNGWGDIGKIKEKNIVLTALSRAREGFYMMGSMKDLTINNTVWSIVKAILEQEDALGDCLRLKCHVHQDQFFEMKTAVDFEKYYKNGCKKMCELMLPCSHPCPLACHLTDRQHEKIECVKECTKTCPAGHLCPMKCEHKCQPCQSDCKIRLPCGHACIEKCHFGAEPFHAEYKCMKDCVKTNAGCANNHPCKKRCYENCESCPVTINKMRSCGHIQHNILCSQDVEELNCTEIQIVCCGSNPSSTK